MAGDTAPTAEQAQALWDDVNKEREAGDTPPLTPADSTPTEPSAATPAANADAAKETTPTTIEPEAKTDPPAPVTPADPLAERFAALEQQLAVIPQLTQSLRTAEGRVAAMQREMDAARAAAKATPGGPTTAQIQAAQGSTKKWDELRGDFPEWAEATEQFVKASLAGLTPQQAQGLTPEQLEAKLSEERATTKRAIQEATVAGKYEDWLDVIHSPPFVDWYGKQGPELRALGASENGRDAIRLLDKYHEATAKPAEVIQEDRKAKLTAAASARPSAAPTSTRKTVDQMTQEELWEYERTRSAKRHAGLNY